MKDLFDFFDRLAANNNRPWFVEHKAEYDELRAAWIQGRHWPGVTRLMLAAPWPASSKKISVRRSSEIAVPWCPQAIWAFWQ